MNKIAVLGPEYSYSHLLGLKVYPNEKLVLCDRIEQVFKEIMGGKVSKGIVPVENMLQGSVRESIMGLLKYNVKINNAYTMPIHHCLAAQDNNYKIIASHLQALAQCSAFVADKSVFECSSTSKAMKSAVDDHSYAAIGSKEAAEHHGLKIIKENIEDNYDNATRFLAISLEETVTGENARTSLFLKPKEDRPGLLFLILAPFASQNINLLKIESLPSGRKMGEYVFYIEIDGNVREERVKAALDFLRNSVEVYSLGSYEVRNLE